MQNAPDTPYFVYFYVFTCEQCQCPCLDTRLVANTPQDETDRDPALWYCKNCNSSNHTAGHRAAVYAKKLLVKSGKCSERGNGGTLIPSQ